MNKGVGTEKSKKGGLSWKGLDLFPIGNVLRNYSAAKAKKDVRAALNVALLDIPQSMAYALIAGLPVQTGIFCASLSTITGPIWASSRFIMLGPSNATAVMLLSVFLSLGYDPTQAIIALPLLLLLVGIIMTVGAFCKVAGITQYISKAVICGYITAAAFLIIINQLKTVCGLHVPRSATFAEALGNFTGGLSQTDWNAVTVSLITLGFYLPLKRWAKGLPTVALALIGTAAVVEFLRHHGLNPEMLSGINASSWPLTLPTFNWSEFSKLASGALAVAFLSMLESSSIAKSLAAQAGDRIDLNQQMLSMGAANFASSLGGGMSVSGSLTRSMLNFRSHPATRMSSVFSGCILVISLFLFGDLIAYIPKAALATLVIMVGISLINMEQIRLMLRTTRNDAVVFLVTFAGGLVLSLDTAIYLGAAISIGLFVRQAARPELREISFDEQGNLVERAPEVQKHRRPEIAIVHVEGDLFFASSDVFLDQMRHLAEHPDLRIIILRMRNAHHLDATAASTIMELTRFARSKNCDLILSGVHPEMETVLSAAGLTDLIGEDNIFRYSPENPTISTRDALKRAREITGVDTADITIFTADKPKED